MNKNSKNWPRNAVVYHIYPRSFKDGNNDGIGDLQGITSKLDYLNDGSEKSLGIGAVWLSPIYKSPMADFGYDIADYCEIDPLFGTMEDFEELVDQAHKRNIKIIMDFVPNHTSVQHPWFVESRSSKDNPKRNWYVWADARQPALRENDHGPVAALRSPHFRQAINGGPDKGVPNPDQNGTPRRAATADIHTSDFAKASSDLRPNNWLSVFGGSGWELDVHTGQYYFHSFLKDQPDLNWRNPEVRKEMEKVLTFWLNKGVDGFRMDAVHHLIKDDQLRDDPYNPDFIPGYSDPYLALLHRYSQGQDETLKIINSFCKLLGQYGDKFIITEVYAPPSGLERYFRACENGLHSPFNFNLIGLPWKAEMYREFVQNFEDTLKENDWPNYVLGNHDRPRVASRLGLNKARLAALMLLTLRGMPFVYYGDELGMFDVPIPEGLVKDPFEKNVPGFKLGRDPQRTPMQWNGDVYAGFSSVPPWLPTAPNSHQENVEVELTEPHSMLNLYKKLIHFRNNSEILRHGKLETVDLRNPGAFGYIRELSGRKIAVAVNFSDTQQNVCFDLPMAKLVLSTNLDIEQGKEVDSSNFLLRANEGYLLEIEQD